MYKVRQRGIARHLILISLICALLGYGCQYRKPSGASLSAMVLGVERVVFLGFHSALSSQETSGVARDPVSGAVFMAEPVPESVAEQLTTILFELVRKEKEYDLIHPGQAEGAVSRILESDPQVTLPNRAVLQELGRTFDADAVLSGHVYRWRERVGTEYGVERPASVAFDLHMVRPSDGAVLWRGRYEKTQQSLSENLLDWSTFSRAGGRWLTAKELAELGLQDLVKEMPGGVPEPEEPQR